MGWRDKLAPTDGQRAFMAWFLGFLGVLLIVVAAFTGDWVRAVVTIPASFVAFAVFHPRGVRGLAVWSR